MPAYRVKRKRGASRAPKRRTRRRRIVRRTKKRVPIRRVARPVRFVMYNQLVQEKVKTRMRYVDTFQLNPGTLDAHLSWKINDLYDPDNRSLGGSPAGGHQPLFRDEWAQIYGKYRVYAVKFTLAFQAIPTDVVANYPTGSTVGGIDTEYLPHQAEAQQSGHIVGWEIGDSTNRFKLISSMRNGLREMGTAQGYGWRYLPTRKTVKLVGLVRTKDVLDDPAAANQSTAMGSNPSNVAYLHVAALSKDGTTAPPVRVDIQIDMYCILSDAKQITTS